jgi:pimeloyl-ACP methyl ester carboxylesterase
MATSGYVDNGGVRIYYEAHGRGVPVLLHHGFTSCAEDWHRFGYVGPLAERFLVVLMDARGHGKSDKPYDPQLYTMDQRSDDVRAVLDALGLERAHYWGYSMGGHTGFHFLKRYPQRVLGFVNGAAGAGFPRRDVAAIRARAEAMASGDLKAIAATWNSNEQTMAALLERNDLRALAACMLGNLDSERVDPATLQVPSLHYVGERDPILPATKATAERMAGASFHVIAGENHLSCFRHSGKVLPLVVGFLEGLSRPD